MQGSITTELEWTQAVVAPQSAPRRREQACMHARHEGITTVLEWAQAVVFPQRKRSTPCIGVLGQLLARGEKNPCTYAIHNNDA